MNMKLKSSLTFVAIFILAFGMVSATSVTQISKIFADKPIVGADSNFDVNGDHVSNNHIEISKTKNQAKSHCLWIISLFSWSFL